MKTFQLRSKVSVTLPNVFVTEIDDLVHQGRYPNRSAAFEEAIKQLLRVHIDTQIESEVAKLRREDEIAEAEAGMEDYAALLEE